MSSLIRMQQQQCNGSNAASTHLSRSCGVCRHDPTIRSSSTCAKFIPCSWRYTSELPIFSCISLLYSSDLASSSASSAHSTLIYNHMWPGHAWMVHACPGCMCRTCHGSSRMHARPLLRLKHKSAVGIAPAVRAACVAMPSRRLQGHGCIAAQERRAELAARHCCVHD